MIRNIQPLLIDFNKMLNSVCDLSEFTLFADLFEITLPCRIPKVTLPSRSVLV